MEENKANASSSQPPTPVPSGPQDQTLSWHLVGAENASVRPQRDTEEEQGPFVIREAERKPGVDEEPCQGRDARHQELCLWEEATGRELSQRVPAAPVQEVSLYRMWSHQGLDPWKMGVSMEWGDGAQQLLYQWQLVPQWQRRAQVQQLPHGEEEGNEPKLSQRREGRVSGQKNQPCSPAPSEEVPSAGAWSLVPAAHSTCCSPSPSSSLLGAHTSNEQQKEAERGSLLPQKGSEEGTSAGDREDCQYNTRRQLSPECQGAAKPELPQGKVNSSQEHSAWDNSIEPEPCHTEVKERQEYIYQRVFVEEDGSHGDHTQSTWQYTCIFSFRVPPSLPEAADWDEVSVLEVREEGRPRSLAALAADELPPPVPREAWVERPAREPLCASPPPLQGRAATAPAASPVLAWQEPGPAPRSPSAAPSERPGRLRRALRALRALFRCRCLAPRTRE